MSSALLLLLLSTFLNYSTVLGERSPVFFVDTENFVEPETVPLTGTIGNQAQQWSGSFSRYHYYDFTGTSDPLILVCETDIPAIVKIAFKETGQFVKYHHFTTKSQVDWPPVQGSNLNSDHGIATVTLKYGNRGGRMQLKPPANLKALMNGEFWCEIQEDNGKTIKSNIIKVNDYRNDLSTLRNADGFKNTILLPLTSGKFGFGATIAPYGTDANQEVYKAQRRYFGSDILGLKPQWARWTFTRDNRGKITMDKQENVIFKNGIDMPKTDLGKYFVDYTGTLHLNLRSDIMANFKLEKINSYDRMLRLVGEREKADKRIFKTDISDEDPQQTQNLPTIVFPANIEENKSVLEENSVDVLQCGFLADGNNLQIKWTKNDKPLSESEMKADGIEIPKTISSGSSLSLSKVKISASGTWQCILSNGENTVLPGTKFILNVLKIPSFGKNTPAPEYRPKEERRPSGAPPPLVFTMDGDTLQLECVISGWNNRELEPQISVIERSPAQNIQYQKKKVLLPDTAEKDSVMTRYTVNNLQGNVKAISMSQSHRVKCHAESVYAKYGKLSTEMSTSVVVFEKFDLSNMETTPKACSERENQCLAREDNMFSCAIKENMKTKITKAGVKLRQKWLLSGQSKEDIAKLDDSAPLKKYTEFSESGTTVTVKVVTNQNDIDVMNKALNDIKCVIELFYPNGTNMQWIRDKAKIFGNGSTLEKFGDVKQVKELSQEFMFYSTENDNTMGHFSANFKLSGEPGVTTAAAWIAAPITIVIILVIAIIIIVGLLVIRNKGETYGIDERERGQGRDPEKELKETTAFPEYMRPEDNTIVRGSRLSLDSSIRVGSDGEDGELDEYDNIEQGKFNEDGSFIGDYHTDPNSAKRELPPTNAGVPPRNSFV